MIRQGLRPKRVDLESRRADSVAALRLHRLLQHDLGDPQRPKDQDKHRRNQHVLFPHTPPLPATAGRYDRVFPDQLRPSPGTSLAQAGAAFSRTRTRTQPDRCREGHCRHGPLHESHQQHRVDGRPRKLQQLPSPLRHPVPCGMGDEGRQDDRSHAFGDDEPEHDVQHRHHRCQGRRAVRARHRG